MSLIGLESEKHFFFVAVFLGWTSTGRVGLWYLWFYVQELPKAQPAVVLVLKRLRRRVNGIFLYWLLMSRNLMWITLPI